MNLRRFTWILLVLYLVISIYAVAVIGFQLPQVISITPVSTLLSYLFAVLHAWQREGWRRAIMLTVIVFLTGLTFESIGVATGWVYGPYHYTQKLGLMFLGLVPYLIPLAWTMMIYPSLVVAGQVVPPQWSGARRMIAVATLGGVIMTAWDLAMDPMMVNGGNWVWEVQGAYFGVPLQNFWGWWLTTFIALLIYQIAAKAVTSPLRSIPDRWVVWSYLITGVSTVIVDLLVGLGGPALAGIFGMAPWVWLGIVHTESTHRFEKEAG
jgi:uncharacterized membrane protein